MTQPSLDIPASVPLTVRILGRFELKDADGRDVSPPRKKLRALVALLALAPTAGWPREQLMDLLWGDRNSEQARGSLRQALAELRRTLGHSILLADRETAAFDPAIVHADAVEFARLAVAGNFEEAAKLYRGALLEGFIPRESGFTDWLLVERTRLHDVAVNVMRQLLARQASGAAIATAQRLLQLDPTHEETHAALMRLYAARGHRSEALRQFQICRVALQRELGVKPNSETERLYREIQSTEKGGAIAQERGRKYHHASAVKGGRRGLGTVSGGKDAETPSYRLDRGNRGDLWVLFSKKRVWVQFAAATFIVFALIGVAARWLSTESADVKPVVAVLPFDDFDGDDAAGRLAGGLTKEIITDLARFPDFQVIAHASTEAYRDRLTSATEIGTALHAAFVVEGSIQRQADRVRIMAVLVDTKTGRHLWSDRWNRPTGEIFAIQTEISEQIANRLGGVGGLVHEARVAPHRKPPANLAAYELYLLATEKLEQINPSDVEEAIRLLNRAAELDPGLARAWVELYHSYFAEAGLDMEPERNGNLAGEAAQRAVNLDPSDAEAHAVYAMSLGDRNDLGRAKAEFETALRLGPNQFEVLTLYALWASSFGEPDRGAETVDQTIRLNPSYPPWSTRIFAHAYFMVGRYEDSLRMIDRLEVKSYNPRTWAYRSGALAALGRTDEARLSIKEALEWFPDLTIESLINVRTYHDRDRKRLTEMMRIAGFPPCATPDYLSKIDKPVRIPECESHL